jgi:hypothetical protein
LVDARKRELEARLAAFIHTAGGAVVAGHVETGADFVGRDQLKAQGERSVVIGGDARYLLVVTGDGNEVRIPTGEAAPDVLLCAYYRDLAAECGRLPLGVVDPRFAQPGPQAEVSLPSIYTDLHVVSVPRDRGEAERRYGLRLARGEEGERQPLLDLVSGDRGGRLVLVGDAGSGKSTFVDYLTYRLADALAKGEAPAVAEGLRGLLPIRLVLRRTAALIRGDDPDAGADLLWRALEQDIARRLGSKVAERLFPVLQQRLLDPKQGGLVLLDGLDEVPESGALREVLLAAVRRLADGLPARSRVLLTARPYAYADPKWHLPGFAELALAPFDGDQVTHFIAHWYRAVRPVMGWDQATAEQRGHALRQAIEERAYLGDLASRPLLLTLMATLHTSWGQLPEDRADLYEESVKLLITRWQTGREVVGPDGQPVREPGIARALGLGEKTLRQALDRLAFETHERQAALAERDDAPADISRGQVIAVFSELCPQDLNPGVLLEYLETRAGLLIARREGVYAFPHRSFQEYLAACHLANSSADFGGELRRRVWEDPTWWREVYLLGVGKKRQGGLGDAVNLVNALVPASPAETDGIGERHWQAAVLGAKALLELKFPGQALGQPHYEAVLRRVRRWLVELITGGRLVPKERLEAGDALALLGDPRPGVGTPPVAEARRCRTSTGSRSPPVPLQWAAPPTTRGPMAMKGPPTRPTCRPSASPATRSPTASSSPSGRRAGTKTKPGGHQRAGPGARGRRRTSRRSRTRTSARHTRTGWMGGRRGAGTDPFGGAGPPGTAPTGPWSASPGTRPWRTVAGSRPRSNPRSRVRGSCCPPRPSGRRPPEARTPGAGPGAMNGARTTPTPARPAWRPPAPWACSPWVRAPSAPST